MSWRPVVCTDAPAVKSALGSARLYQLLIRVRICVVSVDVTQCMIYGTCAHVQWGVAEIQCCVAVSVFIIF